jgi:hypothetical protein
MHEAVPHSTELERVLAIPRRDWQVGADAFAAALTDALRTGRACAVCGGQREHVRGCRQRRIPLSLRGVQAVALFEGHQQQGLLGPIGVGRGKTLIHLLMARVLGSMRPMLVLQGGLIGKTRREWLELAVYWQIPNWLKLISYEVLGRVSGKEELERFQPDLIACDEIHKLKSHKAAVTKRVLTYVEHHRYHSAKKAKCRLCDEGIPPRALVSAGLRTRLRVVGLSGTITSKSLKDFAHIVHMCVPENNVLPTSWHELECWRLALDENVNEISRVAPGALLKLCTPDDWKDGASALTVARRGFARRLRETPGIVATTDSTLGASLQLSEREPPTSPAIEHAFKLLRTAWQLPDGYQCVDGVEVYRHACSLARGYYRVWNPRPPAAWLESRSYWGTAVRYVIKGGKYDSEQDVALNAHRFRITVNDVIQWRNPERKPELPLAHSDPVIGAMHVYDYWKQERERPQPGTGLPFKPNSEAVWICDSVLKDAAAWLESHPRGIVWTDSTAFGPALAKFSGRPYFAEKGLDSSGRYIEDATGPIIASLDANKTGRNLQFKWSDNYYVCPMGDGAETEQALARTHREGQDEDTVTAEFFLGCLEYAVAFDAARSRARFIEESTTNPQKLNYADITFPTAGEIEARTDSARWRKEYDSAS